MARARITQRWISEDFTTETISEIHVDPSFPDAIDEARSQAVRMWRETCAEEVDTELEAGE